MGGLLAKGEGTAAGNPNAALEGPRLKPRLGKFAVVEGRLVAEPDAAEPVGAVPLLNSAHRGHFRFVSKKKRKEKGRSNCEYEADYNAKMTYSCGPSDHNDHTVSVKCIAHLSVYRRNK